VTQEFNQSYSPR